MYNLLLCDDEEDILLALKIYLNESDYHLFEAHNGMEALEIIRRESIDLLLLDIMMPQKDGLSTLAELRTFSNIPVILLTAKSETLDKMIGFNHGADDYITKPFDPMDVKIRVKAQLRRYTTLGSKISSNVLQLGNIQMNDAQKQVTVNGENVTLTYSEYEILKLLMRNPGKCFSPSEIYQQLWKEKPQGSERTIAVHIRHLREKIELDPANPRYLLAVWGQGYRMIGEQK